MSEQNRLEPSADRRPTPLVGQVDDVLITDELARRASHTTDLATESRGLAALADRLASNPGGVFQACAELMLTLDRADSAGVSVLEPDGVFHWCATAGLLSAQRGRRVPRAETLCGTALDRDSLILSREPDRFFPALRGEPRAHEALTMPWHIGNQGSGTIWVVTHTEDGQFDAEDARILAELARFVAAAYRLKVALTEANPAYQEGSWSTAGHVLQPVKTNEAESASAAGFLRAMSVGTVGVVVFKPDGSITDANQTIARMTGYSRHELCHGFDWRTLTPPEYIAAAAHALQDMATTGETAPFEKQILRKDGSRWWGLVAPTRLADAENGAAIIEFIIDITERKQAEAALEQARKRLATTQRVAGVASWDWDPATDHGTASDTISEIFGLRPGEHWENPLQALHLIYSDDRGRHQDLIEAASRDGGGWQNEFRIVRPDDGVVAWLEERAEASRDPATGTLRIAGLVWDITERKTAEEGLRTSEERLRLIVESARNYAIFLTDPQDRIVDWTAGAAAVFGWTKEEAVGQPGNIIYLPEDREAGVFLHELETAGRDGVAPDVRWHLRKDGSRVFIEGNVRALFNPDGSVRGFFKIGQDVTDRRAAEEALKESERRFRTLIEGIPQLVFRSRSSGERTWGSPQWIAFTGYSEERSLGLGWLGAIHPQDRAATMTAWAEAEARGIFSVEHRALRAFDGSYRWFQTRAVPVRCDLDHPEESAGEWIGTSTDIDDQVQARELLARGREELEAVVSARTAELMAAEATLRHSQKMEAVGQLTGGIAHDFNNMLQAVASGLDMARRRLAQGRDEDVLRYMDMAQEAEERAAGLTRRLLAFARRQQLDPKPVDVDGLIAGMADLIRRTMGPGVDVELRLRDGAGRVLCDQSELENTILNLCINARDAMPDGGKLTIGTKYLRLDSAEMAGREELSPGDYASITVTDTGTGMSPDVLERVFEPFYTTKPQGQGTGLGLSQVYGFVRQSNGLARIESALGAGTTAVLYLPKYQAEEAAPDQVQLDPLKHVDDGITVLVVDDETAVRAPVVERLQEIGYRVLEAEDGPAVVRLLHRRVRIDMLVTDVGLPHGMNGRQVAELVRERVPGIPVLFITGYAGSTLPSGTDVISKPFDMNVLLRRIQAMLADRKQGMGG